MPWGATCRLLRSANRASSHARGRVRFSSDVGGDSGTAPFDFTVLTQRGLESLLLQELSELLASIPGAHVVKPLTGAVQLRGPWPVMHVLAHRSRLAGSIAVRLGSPFQCRDEAELVRGLREAPLRSLLPAMSLGRVPLMVRSRGSQLRDWRIEDVVDRELRAMSVAPGAAKAPLPAEARESSSPYKLRLEASVRQDECALELGCSGRLGVRPFVYTSPPSELREASETLPFPTPFRGDVLGPPERQRAQPDWSLRSASAVPGAEVSTPERGHGDVQASVVAAEWHGTKDLSAPYAAALIRHVPLQRLLAEPGGLLVWDPFCGNGTLLLELLATAMGLPTARRGHRFPFAELLPAAPPAESLGSGTGAMAGLAGLTVLGSDFSAGAVLRARRLLHRFCRYHDASLGKLMPSLAPLPSASRREPPGPTVVGSRGVLPRGRRRRAKTRAQEAPPDSQGDGAGNSTAPDASRPPEVTRELLRSFSSSADPEWGVSLPCEVSFNVSPFERVGPYVRGPLVLTRVPREVHALGPTVRVCRLYERFGHFLRGREDLSGAYVLAETPEFKRHSRLNWDVLLRFRDHAGRKCQLLRLNRF